MIYKVVYFTRTGNNKRIAEKISKEIPSTLLEITDNKNWNGVLGFIKGGFYSSSNKEVEIEVHGNIDNTDEIILVAPLWAGKICPAVREFLKNRPFDNIHLVISSNGSTLKESFLFKSINEIIKKKNNEDLVIKTLIESLK
jgi:hypothetical protein